MIPSRLPLWTMLSAVVALVLSFGICKLWLAEAVTPAERFYFPAYVRSVAPFPQVQTFKTAAGPQRYRAREFHRWLSERIYDQGNAFRVPLVSTALITGICLAIGGQKDHARYKRLFVTGERIRGPEMLSRRQWNSRRKQDGFRLEVE
jgi:hypothetical protein